LKKNNPLIKPTPIVLLFFIFFIVQSLSVISATNLVVFISQYEKLVVSGIFFLVAIAVSKIDKVNFNKNILKVFIISTCFNLLLELIIYFGQSSSLNVLAKFIHSGVIGIVEINLKRNRLYFDYYDEIILPILVAYFVYKNRKDRWSLAGLILGQIIVVIAFISNIRSRLVMLFFSYIYAMLLIAKKHLRLALVIIGLNIILVGALHFYISSYQGYSIFNRILLEDEREDVLTIDFRKKMIERAYDIGNNSILGVGLGNFYEYVPTNLKNQTFSLTANRRQEYFPSLLYPHNWLAQNYAEMGLVGGIVSLIMVMFFIVTDLKLLRKSSTIEQRACIGTFWSLMIYAFLNPIAPLTFYANFWILRIIIANTKSSYS